MTHDEILKKAQQQGDDEYEVTVQRKSDHWACEISGFLCFFLILIKLIFQKEFDFGVLSAFAAISATQAVAEYKQTKKKSTLIFSILGFFVLGVSVFIFIAKTIGAGK